ncbi:hypothetical protein D1614_21590 [Maribellus luteus]|uniref:Uncharacterized protein n=1 Tax=Maribellus luteus TaxID=2305463 RepID=A0A399SS32_9BACT|nr:hypothetical protein D1614_21590 [Maribellus luteus]
MKNSFITVITKQIQRHFTESHNWKKWTCNSKTGIKVLKNRRIMRAKSPLPAWKFRLPATALI